MYRNFRRKLRISGIVFAGLTLVGLVRGQFAVSVGHDRRVITRSDDPGVFWAAEAGGAALVAVCLFASL